MKYCSTRMQKWLNLVLDVGPGFVLSICAIVQLRKAIVKCDSIEKLVNLAYSFRCWKISIRPMQIREEIMKLLQILEKVSPRTILEIGTAGGGTLFLFTRAALPDATIISIDLPGGPFGGGYPRWKIPLYKSFARDHQKIHLIRADSHNPETFREVKEILGDKLIDFLFIDGDHSYEGVKKDFEIYAALVKKGGIIAFHDIVPHPPETGCEVSKFWNKVKYGYRSYEIVKDWNQKWAGIGVLYV